MGVKLHIKKKEVTKSNPAAQTMVVGTVDSGRHLGKRSKIVLICLMSVLVACAIAFYIGASKKPAVVTRSCANDKELITRYNEVMQKRGATKLREIDQDFDKKDTTNDITCKYMLMMLQYGDTSNSGEIETFKQLKQLETQGQNVSKDIKDGVDRQSLENFMQQKIDNESKNYYGEG